MRITSKIMQSNSLTNMNRNKVLHDKLNTQMTTMKKLTKASDDPVIAIRALRLRTSVSEITQYAKKNVPDARSWLSVTEDYLLETSTVLTDIYSQFNKGANGDKDITSRQAILKSVKSLRDQIYSAADADYAGRGLFTGYRTDTKATFQNNTAQKYSIMEQFKRGNIETLEYIDTQDLAGANGGNYAGLGATEQNVGKKDIKRIRLSYGNLDATAGKASLSIVKDKGKLNVTDIPAPGNGTQMTLPARGPTATSDTIELKPAAGTGKLHVYVNGVASAAHVEGESNYTYTNAAGEEVTIGLDVKNGVTSLDSNYTISEKIAVTTLSATGTPNPYTTLGAGDVFFVPETGELLLGDTAYTKLNNLGNNDEIRVSYEKSQWKKGDLNPENYFSCETQKDGKDIEYNPKYLTDGKTLQEIEYDVGFNQTLRVNTTVDEVFGHNIGRDVDEMVAILEEFVNMDSVVKTLQEVVDKDPTDATAKAKLDAAKRAHSLLEDKLGKKFESGMTSMQGYSDKVNVAVADSGTRSARLDMIENRLTTQLTTFDILASENENIDLTEVAIELGSVELAYEAALMAVGKVAQTSLLNYI